MEKLPRNYRIPNIKHSFVQFNLILFRTTLSDDLSSLLTNIIADITSYRIRHFNTNPAAQAHVQHCGVSLLNFHFNVISSFSLQ